jgi:hypothetical protein
VEEKSRRLDHFRSQGHLILEILLNGGHFQTNDKTWRWLCYIKDSIGWIALWWCPADRGCICRLFLIWQLLHIGSLYNFEIIAALLRTRK